MTTFIEQTFKVPGGYEITLTKEGASVLDTSTVDPKDLDSQPDQVHLEPKTAEEARTLSVALRFAQRRIEAIWREMRAEEERR